MNLYKNIEHIIEEVSEIENNSYIKTKETIEYLKLNNKNNIAFNLGLSLRDVCRYKQLKKQELITGILGISDIEYIEIISKTTHIWRLNANNYLFLQNKYKLKEIRLHTNSIKIVCKLMNIELNKEL